MATNKVDEKSFGAKMKQLRQLRKVSFETLANKTGLSHRYLRDIEEGKIIPPVSAVIQISKSLSIDSGSFLSAQEQEALAGCPAIPASRTCAVTTSAWSRSPPRKRWPRSNKSWLRSR